VILQNRGAHAYTLVCRLSYYNDWIYGILATRRKENMETGCRKPFR